MKKELPPAVKKYLDKYSEVTWMPEKEIEGAITAVTAIPAIKEYDNILKLFSSLVKTNKEYFPVTAFLFIINNSEDAAPDVREDNIKTLKFLRSITENKPENSLAADIINSGMKITFIDASTEGNELPAKDAGVGMARKICMDAALTLFDYNAPGKKIIICLDADCIVEQNYLSEVIKAFNLRGLNAAGIYFEHDIEQDKTSSAIICYEIFLRYYVLGMFYAGSPYAYHTVGSTICCDYESYIKAEGMNKRKAAEDFYFLQKIAKNSIYPGLEKPLISGINSTTVHPAARGSWRVPFGTGQRVNRFISGERDEYTLHDPECFIILKKWLNLFHSIESNDYSYLIEKAEAIDEQLGIFLTRQDFKKHWEHIIKNSATGIQIQKQKINWFDAFRTMKLIHHLRDNGYPDIDMFDALDKFFTITNTPGINRNDKPVPSSEIQKEYLYKLRIMDKEKE